MGLTAIVAIAVFVTVFAGAFVWSWFTLHQLIGSAVMPDDNAKKLASEWSLICAFVLGSWSVLSIAAGPQMPVVVFVTACFVGAFLTIPSIRSRSTMAPGDWRKGIFRFVRNWTLLTGSSVLLSFGVLHLLGAMLIDD